MLVNKKLYPINLFRYFLDLIFANINIRANKYKDNIKGSATNSKENMPIVPSKLVMFKIDWIKISKIMKSGFNRDLKIQ